MKLKVKKLTQTAKIPIRSNPNDVGYDLYIDKIEDLGDRLKIHTGIAIEPEEGWYFELASRSSVHKTGLSLCNGIGILDNSYRGEVIGIFYKIHSNAYSYDYIPGEIKVGERFLQIIPHQYVNVEIIEVEQLTETERSIGGFGSSGKN